VLGEGLAFAVLSIVADCTAMLFSQDLGDFSCIR